MKRFMLFIFFIGVVLPVLPVNGADDTSLIVDKLAGKNGFTMRFEQSSKYKFLNKPKVSKGKLLFSPPKNFVWEIEGENAGKIVSNGKKTWVYSPAEEEGDTPTVLVIKGLYDGVQSIVFDPKYSESSLTKQGSLRGLKVKGSKDKGYLWAEIWFSDSPDFRIDSVMFEDIEGTIVSIKVNSFDRLSKMPALSAFNFKSPKKARIITR